jgi:hypothetical protein
MSMQFHLHHLATTLLCEGRQIHELADLLRRSFLIPGDRSVTPLTGAAVPRTNVSTIPCQSFLLMNPVRVYEEPVGVATGLLPNT